jgi:Ring finger domain
MYPWHETRVDTVQQPADGTDEAPEPQQPQQYSTSERQRPKKLPCGHILHFYCLRSWLERQQTCPTCRRSVLDPPQPQTSAGRAALANRANGAAREPLAPNAGAAHARNPNENPPAPGQALDANGQQVQRGLFQIRLPAAFNLRMDENLRNRLRAVFNNAGVNQPPLAQPAANVQQAPVGDNAGVGQVPVNQQQPATHTIAGQSSSHSQNPIPPPPPNSAMEPLRPHLHSHIVHTQLAAIEAHLSMEIQSLHIAAQRSAILRQMQAELDRLRQAQGSLEARTTQIAMQAMERPLDLNVTPASSNTMHVPGGPPMVPGGYTTLPLHPILQNRPQVHTPSFVQFGSSSTPENSVGGPSQVQATSSAGASSEHQSLSAPSLSSAGNQGGGSNTATAPPFGAQLLNFNLQNGGFPILPTPLQSRTPSQQPGQQPGMHNPQFIPNPSQFQSALPNGQNVVWMPLQNQGMQQVAGESSVQENLNAFMDQFNPNRSQSNPFSGFEHELQRLQTLIGDVSSTAGTSSTVPTVPGTNPTSLVEGTSLPDENTDILTRRASDVDGIQQTADIAADRNSEVPANDLVSQNADEVSAQRPSEPVIPSVESTNSTANPFQSFQPAWSFNPTATSPLTSLGSARNLSSAAAQLDTGNASNLVGSSALIEPFASNPSGDAAESTPNGDSPHEHDALETGDGTGKKAKGKERLVDTPNGNGSASKVGPDSVSEATQSRNPTVEDVEDLDA